MGKKSIFGRALEMRSAGKLYDLKIDALENNFRGSIDRFCEIAARLRGAKKILDVGAGGGLLLSLLSELGHECYAVDISDLPSISPEIFRDKGIEFRQCNVEVDPIPYPDNYFDGIVCCQTLEHFTHSHLNAMKEMFLKLKHGGLVEVDVPNAVSFRNRSRMLRGKNITWDYEKHYLHTEAVQYKGKSFYPDRHNREFTLSELVMLLKEAGFRNIDAYHLRSMRYRTGWERALHLGTLIRDTVPSMRKSLIAFGEK
jgi:ubiquinone/menaquinone biosynthesis C-methylase UbiE